MVSDQSDIASQRILIPLACKLCKMMFDYSALFIVCTTLPRQGLEIMNHHY